MNQLLRVFLFACWLLLTACSSGPSSVAMPPGYVPFASASYRVRPVVPSKVAAPTAYAPLGRVGGESSDSVPSSEGAAAPLAAGTSGTVQAAASPAEPAPAPFRRPAPEIARDSAPFAITAPRAAPGTVSTCGRHVTVSGHLRGGLQAGQEIIILVHPLATQYAWVQDRATIDTNRGDVLFESLIALGEWGAADRNNYYEVIAVVVPAGKYSAALDPLGRIQADMTPVSQSVLLFRDRD